MSRSFLKTVLYKRFIFSRAKVISPEVDLDLSGFVLKFGKKRALPIILREHDTSGERHILEGIGVGRKKYRVSSSRWYSRQRAREDRD